MRSAWTEIDRYSLHVNYSDMSSDRGTLKRKLNDGEYDFLESAHYLQAVAKELSEQCVQRVSDCEALEAELQQNFESVVAEANNEASKVRAAYAAEQLAWQEEKKKLAHIQEFKSQVMLDVGGNKFTTSLTTLQRFPDSMIGAMFSGRHALPTTGEYFFIDRDGTHFRHILNFLRQPEGFKVDLPPEQLDELKRECEYYGLLAVMFSWKPAPPVIMRAVNGNLVCVTQGKDALWYVDSEPLRVCRSCHAAELTTEQSFMKHFKTRHHARTIADAQPQPAVVCALCHAAPKT
jgi:hypothetical protein